jgi:hypothetical protein
MRRRVLAFTTSAILMISGLVATPQAAMAADVLQEVTLAKGPADMGEPMSLAVLPDRTVLYTSRDGRIFSTDASGNTSLAGTITAPTRTSPAGRATTSCPASPSGPTARWT